MQYDSWLYAAVFGANRVSVIRLNTFIRKRYRIKKKVAYWVVDAKRCFMNIMDKLIMSTPLNDTDEEIALHASSSSSLLLVNVYTIHTCIRIIFTWRNVRPSSRKSRNGTSVSSGLRSSFQPVVVRYWAPDTAQIGVFTPVIWYGN